MSAVIRLNQQYRNMSFWTELADNEYGAVWDRFYADFKFKPNYHERSLPAILEPTPSITFDLSTISTESAIDEIGTVLATAFISASPADSLMYALDWQHTSYKFDPRAENPNAPIKWFPDGDYHIFLACDFTFGTFGHPWQRSLCLFGKSLLKHAFLKQLSSGFGFPFE